MLLPLYMDNDRPKKDKSSGLTTTEIIKMSQDISTDWLKKDANIENKKNDEEKKRTKSECFC